MGNRLAAHSAPPIVTRLNPAQRCIDLVELDFSALLSCKRHRLHLHGIDAREPADTVLIQCDRGAIGRGSSIVGQKLGAEIQQALSSYGKAVLHRQRISNTGTCTVRIIAVVVLPTINVRSGE